MNSQPIESIVTDVVRVSAGHIQQFISAQSYSQTDELIFFQSQLNLLQGGTIAANNIPHFTSLLSHFSQSPHVANNQLLNQHFLVLKRHFSVAINTTVNIGQNNRQLASNSNPTTTAPIPINENASAASVTASGSMFGKYKVVKKVGEGGNGIVYLGINPISQQRVALKCLTNLQSQELIDAVRDEARVAARINHPNCVKVRDMVVDESRGSPVIVSDFIDGVNGRDFIDHSVLHKFELNVLPAKAALLMIEQMVKGVRAAHKTGIVHRDIKPENFLVTREAISELESLPNDGDLTKAVNQTLENRRDDAWVLLSDWGLALEKKGLSLTTSKTFDLGTIPLNKQGGTLVYMPIEQIEGSNIGRKSDVFALGLVLYELLTGASALEARSFAEDISNDPNMSAQAFLVAVASSRARSSIDPKKDPHLKRFSKRKDLMKLLQAMTARDREERLSSSGLEAAIQDLLAGKRLNLVVTQSSRLNKQELPADSNEEAGTAVLFLQGLSIGLVLLLVSVIGFAVFSKSEKNTTDIPKTAQINDSPKVDHSKQAIRKDTPATKPEPKPAIPDPSPKPLNEKPIESPKNSAKSPLTPPKPTISAKKDRLAKFRAKYQVSMRQSEPLIITEEDLTIEELSFLLQYKGRRLELNLFELSPEFASILSQSKAEGLKFGKLRYLSAESLGKFQVFRGMDLVFAKLKTLHPDTAASLGKLKVQRIYFTRFRSTPSIEALGAVRGGLLNARSRMKVVWPRKTVIFIQQNLDAINEVIRSKIAKNGSNQARPAPLRKASANVKANRTIWTQIESGNLENIGELTDFRPGIPALLVQFAHKQGKKVLNLSKVKNLIPPSASKLVGFSGQLILSGMTDVEKLSKILSTFKGQELDLSGVNNFSKETLQLLSEAETTLILGIRSPSSELIQSLAKGQLKGLEFSKMKNVSKRSLDSLGSSKLPFLKLGLANLNSGSLQSFINYKGILELPKIAFLAPEWIPVLKSCKAKEIRFSGLIVFPNDTVRVLRQCSPEERAKLRDLLRVSGKFSDKLRVALR